MASVKACDIMAPTLFFSTQEQVLHRVTSAELASIKAHEMTITMANINGIFQARPIELDYEVISSVDRGAQLPKQFPMSTKL